MKITGLCKTFSCGDYLPAILKTIYPFMDKIVFVNSDTNWIGQKGVNECTRVIDMWSNESDLQKKIVKLNCSASTQEEQYQVGYDYIKNNIDADWIFIFDTDEVWDCVNLQTLISHAKSNESINAYAVKMHTYIKSPLYRITPEEPCTPCVMVRPVFNSLNGIRGNSTRPMVILPEVKFHHFSYVRKTEHEVFNKIRTSIVGDCEDLSILKTIDLQVWKKEKWDKLPTSKNLQTTAGFESAWAGVEVIDKSKLPLSIQSLPIIKQLIEEGQNGR